ncbi:hypothetical protein [Photobacterium damselae]|uniref:hypothetical protein n=1 Tax=Photobacterium damselae TaxID=38293 RepID=UPI0035A88739
MSAKKTLKKLKKKAVKKVLSSSQKKLLNLEKGSESRKKGSVGDNFKRSALFDDLVQVTNQAALSAAYELAVPLKPILSWFDDASGIVDMTFSTREDDIRVAKQKTKYKDAQSLSVRSIGYLPLKSPPCKRCPALSNGICKCAAKKFKLN